MATENLFFAVLHPVSPVDFGVARMYPVWGLSSVPWVSHVPDFALALPSVLTLPAPDFVAVVLLPLLLD